MADNECVDDSQQTTTAPSAQGSASPDGISGSANLGSVTDKQNGDTATATAPNVQGQLGNNGVWAQGSAGSVSISNGTAGVEIEGPNARGGARMTNDGMCQAGVQANYGGVGVSYTGETVTAKAGLNAGVGLEGRLYGGNRCGAGADIGPVSADIYANKSCADLAPTPSAEQAKQIETNGYPVGRRATR